MSLESSLRERKKRKTRDALVQNAVRLFQAQGYDETTVDQIVDAVEVSPSTFFRYFATKEDILFYDHGEFVALFQESMSSLKRGASALQSLQHGALRVAEELERKRDEVIPRLKLVFSVPALVAHNLHLDQEWLKVITALIALERGVDPEKNLDVQILASAAVGSLWTTVRVWVKGNGRDKLRSLTQRAFRTLESGFKNRTR